ncbi:PIN domain-containing protein [Flavobacterium sp. LHD-85]|uniref:PIN domain-containing protein n=1 Tax=Flavobacterium sp. LHD-85 TaxID=3071410 RepID=UPI0027DEEC62|nr:PIN domain-containing protein [Flavobacterium sp. LHD-85]MDQ6528423.1 PIN domain-containing protein [Flavobacterium sp. LHD-85]
MKVLLDTNIIIHREANKIYKPEIGQLFKWIDNLKYSKYIHPLTVEELKRYRDLNALDTMSIKIESYNLLKHQAPLGEEILKVSKKIDNQDNDINDTQILNEVYEGRVNILISEDKKIHTKANLLGISNKVYKIQTFLEKVISENPELVNYKVLSVQKVDFAKVNIKDSFFDSFREDYKEFDIWFNDKSEESCYVCYSDGNLTAFLFVKIESEKENYSNISPFFQPKKRLKIGTLKVTGNGYKIGERFLKTIFDNALQYNVEEIYVTLFTKRPEQEQLIEMLEEWGFLFHGIKTTKNGEERVYVRSFGKNLPKNIQNPKLTFPFFSWETNKYIIKIEPQYHTELFPDSINTREDKSKYIENEPYRNRISKVYISHSKDRNLKSGDIVLIYRIGEEGTQKIYTSTITTICIVENIKNEFENFDEFFETCNRKTMISKEDLRNKWWDKFPKYRPFVINFLFAYSLPTPKPTIKDLIDLKIFEDSKSIPLGIIKLTDEQFKDLINFAYKIKKIL